MKYRAYIDDIFSMSLMVILLFTFFGSFLFEKRTKSDIVIKVLLLNTFAALYSILLLYSNCIEVITHYISSLYIFLIIPAYILSAVISIIINLFLMKRNTGFKKDIENRKNPIIHNWKLYTLIIVTLIILLYLNHLFGFLYWIIF